MNLYTVMPVVEPGKVIFMSLDANVQNKKYDYQQY